MSKKFVATLAGAVLLVAVIWLPPWSFFPASDAIDEASPETDAAITISDPLLYARETLINDRRREYEFLNALLSDSASSKVQFTPQMQRDFGVISAFTGRIGISSGKSAPSPNDPGAKLGPQNPEVANSAQGGTPSQIQYSPQEEFRDRQAYRGELRAALATVNLDDLHDFAGNALFRLQFKASVFPGETKNKFGVARLLVQAPEISEQELLSIYLTWLGHVSSRLNVYGPQGELLIDGRYDAMGIAPRFAEIFRLSFDLRATNVREDICIIYTFSTSSDTPPQICSVLALAVAPETFGMIRSIFQDRIDAQLVTIAEQFRDPQFPFRTACSDPVRQEKLKQWITAATAAVQVIPTLQAALDGVALGNASSDVVATESGKSDDFRDLRSQYKRLGQSAARLRDYLRTLDAAAATFLIVINNQRHTALADCALAPPDRPAELRSRALQTPNAFKEALVTGKSARGQAYGFGATPAEMAQRLTTTARATASMDLALALQAINQEKGIDSAAGFAQRAAQTAAALERVPLVVGFTDRRPLGDANGVATPQFGWVFGPRLRYDALAGKFKFEQSVASYDVSADISVPSWWPRIDLQVETAWAKNWHATPDVLPFLTADAKKAAGHGYRNRLSIPLPLNRADLDGLTKFLTQRAFGRAQELTSIRFVEPSVLSACAERVTFLIYGANIWRSAEVYLGGAPASEVKVLPDMEGIAASFNLSTLLGHANSSRNPFGYDEVALRVNTRNGNDWRPIRIIGHQRGWPTPEGQIQESRQAKDLAESKRVECDAPYSVTTPIVRSVQARAPVVYELSPSKIPACATDISMVASGRHLLSLEKKPPDFYLAAQKGEVRVIGEGEEINSTQVLEIKFKLPPGTSHSARHVPLIVATERGLVTISIDYTPCPNEGTTGLVETGRKAQ